jgi:hypothetical protein
MPFARRVPADMAAAVVLTSISAFAVLAQDAGGPEGPADIVAAQIRSQGHACVAPVVATRDPQVSSPNGAVWLLDCRNARYRVRLVPDMAAEVVRLR